MMMCIRFNIYPTRRSTFKGIRSEEIPAIRAAFAATEEPVHITMVVAQTQHNIQVVPDVERQAHTGHGRRNSEHKNLPSGSCVDDNRVLSFSDGAVVDSKKQPFAFFLVPHFSKATAKAVYYRVLLNENEDLDRDALEQITFRMSYSYSSATKATRNIPVISYSCRLANQVYGMFQVTMDA
jgi:Piwi domain